MISTQDKVFKFDEQLKVGDNGEADFLRFYKNLEPKKNTVDFRIDFDLKNGQTVELKTDTYSMKKTKNFFMERYTVTGDNKKDGGPWRTAIHGVDYFVYYFISDGVFFWFPPTVLRDFLDEYVRLNRLDLVHIPNVNKSGGYYEAQGYKIPRDVVKSVLFKEHKYEVRVQS
jgi:hypothetical protein